MTECEMCNRKKAWIKIKPLLTKISTPMCKSCFYHYVDELKKSDEWLDKNKLDLQ